VILGEVEGKKLGLHLSCKTEFSEQQ
jgi:hypothetical protein